MYSKNYPTRSIQIGTASKNTGQGSKELLANYVWKVITIFAILFCGTNNLNTFNISYIISGIETIDEAIYEMSLLEDLQPIIPSVTTCPALPRDTSSSISIEIHDLESNIKKYKISQTALFLMNNEPTLFYIEESDDSFVVKILEDDIKVNYILAQVFLVNMYLFDSLISLLENNEKYGAGDKRKLMVFATRAKIWGGKWEDCKAKVECSEQKDLESEYCELVYDISYFIFNGDWCLELKNIKLGQ